MEMMEHFGVLVGMQGIWSNDKIRYFECVKMPEYLSIIIFMKTEIVPFQVTQICCLLKVGWMTFLN